MDDPVSAIAFPRADIEFCRTVAVEVSRLALAGARRPSDLMDALRDRYPAVVVVARDHLADLMPRSGRIWYVYRDGSLFDSQQAVAVPVETNDQHAGPAPVPEDAPGRREALADSRN